MDETGVPITSTLKNEESVTVGNNISEISKADVQMRWYFLGLVTLWIIATMACLLVALYLTKNPACLSGFTALAPPVYISYRIVIYLFPKHIGDYQIELEKIKSQHVNHEQHNKTEPHRRTMFIHKK